MDEPATNQPHLRENLSTVICRVTSDGFDQLSNPDSWFSLYGFPVYIV